jgi:acetyl-CoA acetyltransferase
MATTTRAAVAGVGYTSFSRRSGRSVLDLAREACANAIDDAGLQRGEIDGVASFMLMDDSVPCQAVATVLGLGDLRYTLDAQLGGQAPCYLVWNAAAMVATGQARNIVVFRAMNGRSARRVGTMQFPGMGAQYRYPVGYDAYMMYVAMWAKRFMIETGTSSADLAAVALAQRAYAADNERAFRRVPLDIDAYMASPYVVEPFRADDCTIEVDGACAVVVTTLERARDLRHPPAVVAAGAYSAGSRSGLDIGDHLLWDDYSRNYTSHLRDDLFARAGLGPSEMQFAEIYDCFSSTVLIGLEGLGICGRGEAGGFVRSGATALDGSLPTNTHGGLLSEGYLHGMNTVAEAVLQIQGRGGARQAPRHDACAVTSGALMDGSALVLTADA